MASDAKSVLTGGCQCGAIRFAVSGLPARVSICHCRMCQKAAGAPFASFADIEKSDFAWTRGKPAAFKSSSIAERDFCAACGTPLSFRRIDGPRVEIMTGAFDRPDRLVPTRQYGTESRLGWVVGVANMPSQTTLQNYGADKVNGIVSHQHPDHDRGPVNRMALTVRYAILAIEPVMPGLVPGIHVVLSFKRQDVDGRNTRLRQGFAGFPVLVRRSSSEGGSPAMTNEAS